MANQTVQHTHLSTHQTRPASEQRRSMHSNLLTQSRRCVAWAESWRTLILILASPGEEQEEMERVDGWLDKDKAEINQSEGEGGGRRGLGAGQTCHEALRSRSLSRGTGGGGILRSAGRAVDVACSLIISSKVSRPFSVLSPPPDKADFTSKYVKACILANTWTTAHSHPRDAPGGLLIISFQ